MGMCLSSYLTKMLDQEELRSPSFMVQRSIAVAQCVVDKVSFDS